LQSLEGLGFDLALTGFSLDEIRTLEDPTHGGRTGDDDAPELRPTRSAQTGRDLALGCPSAAVRRRDIDGAVRA